MEKSKYHNISILTSDVYAKAGSKIFIEFDRGKKSDFDDEKNLLVLPRNIFDELKYLKKNPKYQNKLEEFFADLDTYISNNKMGSLEVDFNKDKKFNFSIGSISGGLDIALVDGSENLEFLVDSLKSFNPDELKIVSSNPETRFDYKSKQLPVEAPKLLLGDISILNQGIINGPKTLEARLNESENKTLPVEEAEQFFDKKELYMNQVVRLGKEEYAIVEGDIVRGRWGAISRADNMRIRLLHPREKSKKIVLGNEISPSFIGLTPRDMTQYIALQYGLLNPNVSLLFLVGGAGSGKTLLSYAAAMYQRLEFSEKALKNKRWENPFDRPNPLSGIDDPLHLMSKLSKGAGRAPIYSNLVLLKSDNAAGGREVGFLPGSLYDKIVDDLKPFEDAHKILHFYRDFEFGDLIYHQDRELPRIGGPRSPAAAKAEYDGGKLPRGPALEVTHFSKFRGRSFENTFLVVDEAQNFTPQEMQVIITRMGTGSKVVILGDPNKQIDNIDCSRNYNGIVQPVEEFLDKPYSMLINLGSKYRSEMAKDGDNWNV